MKAIIPLLLCCLGFSQGLFAQEDPGPNLWKKSGSLQYTLDLKLLDQRLQPLRDGQETVLQLPMPNGRLQKFRVYYAPIMHPRLAQKFPEIRAYAGYGLDDPGASIRFDRSPKGFHAQILSVGKPAVYIDPVASGYRVYEKKDLPPGAHSGLNCLLERKESGARPAQEGARRMPGDCQFRSYRLALACTGEYAISHGGTLADALAAMHATMVRVNGIYERELAITMEFIPNNDLIVHLDPGTDMYDNANTMNLPGQNQTKIDAVIGNGFYDIGHVFSHVSSGVPEGYAAPAVVCIGPGKAMGASRQGSMTGDAFDVNIVAHEMGHQFGANHTQNTQNVGCAQNDPTAVEPGSGSTIMGYAGICFPNVQNNSDDYFHAISLQEIVDHAVFGPGNSCPLTMPIPNNPPVIVGATGTHVLPVRTPFKLEASATDPDGDVLSYCWEQTDNQVGFPMPPQTASAGGPAFRSYLPVSQPYRYFPRLDDLLNNMTSLWERLPSVSRNMNFRVTVRDNHPTGGCTAEESTLLTFTDLAGPFRVTNPNINDCWVSGEPQAIVWNVANTDAAPVNCSQVDILLSVDGGYTYSILLADDVPNTGMALVSAPAITTSQARVMVMCSDNIFFDISDQNFGIDECPPSQTISVSTPSGVYKAALTIETSGMVSVTGFARFQAGVEVLLQDGFTAELGSDFAAIIQPCDQCPAFLNVDKDRTPEQTKEGKREGPAGLPVDVFPNPTNGIFYVEFHLEKESPLAVRIVDLSGRQPPLSFDHGRLKAGEHRLTIDGKELPTGYYLCTIISEVGTGQVRLVKIKS